MRMAVPEAKRMLGRTEAAAAAAREESRAAGKGLELGGHAMPSCGCGFEMRIIIRILGS